jgi:hypothetical protein
MARCGWYLHGRPCPRKAVTTRLEKPICAECLPITDARLHLMAEVLALVDAGDREGALRLTMQRAGALGMPGLVAAAERRLAEMGRAN